MIYSEVETRCLVGKKITIDDHISPGDAGPRARLNRAIGMARHLTLGSDRPASNVESEEIRHKVCLPDFNNTLVLRVHSLNGKE